LLNHLLARIKDRQISADQLGQLADWLDSEPEVPEGRWFKRFSGMTVCGEGELRLEQKSFETPNGKSRPERSRTGRRHFWIRLGEHRPACSRKLSELACPFRLPAETPAICDSTFRWR